jgi:TonB family protein
MKKLLLILFSLFNTATAFAQVMDTKYFSNKNLQREVPAARAKYVQVVTKNPDGSITTEVTDMARNEVINSQTYKGEEPTGVRKYRGGSIFDKLEHVYVMDYSFDLKYADAPCADTIAGLRDFSKDNASLKYTAPKVAGDYNTISDFLVHNIYYPDAAREGGIQGKVLLTLKINATGTIEHVVVKKGVNIILDKEAVRVMKLLKLASPPMLDGKPVGFCIVMPLNFTLE